MRMLIFKQKQLKTHSAHSGSSTAPHHVPHIANILGPHRHDQRDGGEADTSGAGYEERTSVCGYARSL